MTVKLNQQGLRQARSLVRAGKVVRDERDDWSEDAPTPVSYTHLTLPTN